MVSADAVRQVIERLEAIPPTIEGNREMLAWLRGERQWYEEDEKRHRPVHLIDFEHPGENVVHVTWEWKLKSPARKGNRVWFRNATVILMVDRTELGRGMSIGRRRRCPNIAFGGMVSHDVSKRYRRYGETGG